MVLLPANNTFGPATGKAIEKLARPLKNQSGYGGYRLANGSTRCSGRVELLHGGAWGILCDSQWDLQAAHALCQQLDCGFALSMPAGQLFGTGDGPVWNGTFGCERNESHLRDCPVTALGWEVNSEDEPLNPEAALAKDSNCADELRLVNGSSPCAGRVEVKHQDQWGTVCDDGWDMAAAGVVCKELGCGVALSAHRNAHFGEGSGQIWLDNTDCRGTESAVWECEHNSWGEHNCRHVEDAGVTCSGRLEPQLIGGNTACSGRVEIRHGDTWTTVCDSHLDLQAASVICNELDCGTVVSTPGGARFSEGYGSIWSEKIHCLGNESHLVYCPRTLHPNETCSHSSDASIVCSGRSESLRLLNGESRCDGRVEISLHGVWGRVLDDQWDMDDASVVCRQLQCGVAEKAYNPPKPQRGRGPVGLRRVQCAGNETRLTLCDISPPETTQAGIADDVGVVCSEFTDLRLVSESDCAGRLEVFYNGTWGSVCSNQMSGVTPEIVCKQLHCGDGGQLARDFAYGEGSGPTWLDHVSCREQDRSLWQCPSGLWKQQSCDNRAEETHISCSGVTETTDSLTRTDSRRSLDPFSEAVYEEIDYNLMRKKQIFGRSDDSVAKLRYYTGDSEGENDFASEEEGAFPGGSQLDYDNVEEPASSNIPRTPDGQEVPALPGGAPWDGYDEAREVSNTEDDPASGPSAQEVTGAHEDSDRNRDDQTGPNPKGSDLQRHLGPLTSIDFNGT
ncbi:Deleted in malignant brain tumors 1 protein [Chelonia mydas]|uniref:Deleted in malignant brain tumors 1 protein n=1 Tax=Chelonia mydas TaxID=8469 RepID=M7C9B1_CHEMY|nr:Deleted in malignant brain tumors 1 protein [Chelonia mydas]